MPAILDQYGKPFTVEQAPQEVFGVRTGAPSASTADGLTPASMLTILREADEGDITAQSQLFEEMEERNPDISAHMQTRRAGVLSCPWEIRPAEPANPKSQIPNPKSAIRNPQSAMAQKAADLCEEVVAAIPNFDTRLMELLSAMGHGFSMLEIHWETSEKQWTVTKLTHRPQRWFRLDKNDYDVLRLRDSKNWDGLELNPLNWLEHRHPAKAGGLARLGLCRALARPYVISSYAVKDWLAFAEVYGQPLRVGRYEIGARQEEVTLLWQMVRDMGADMAAVFPKNQEIEIKDFNRASSAEIYDKLLSRAGDWITLIILGQLLTSGMAGGGSLALGEVHERVRSDLTESDAKLLSGTVKARLFGPLVRLNLGPEAPVPDFAIQTPDRDDLAEVRANVDAAQKAGLSVGADWLRKKLRIPEPEPGEEVLSPPAPAPPFAANNLLPQRSQRSQRSQRTENQNPVSPLPFSSVPSVPSVANAFNPILDEKNSEAFRLRNKLAEAFNAERVAVDSDTWAQLSPAGRQRAFFAQDLSRDQLQRVLDTLRESYAAGEDVLAWRDRLGPLDADLPLNRVELWRNNFVAGANAAGREIQMRQTAQQRPYAQYVSMPDARPSHLALNGVIKPLDDPFWDRYTPPWDYNCRCQKLSLGPEELAAEGLAVSDDADISKAWQRVSEDAGVMPSTAMPPPNPDWTFVRGDAYYLRSAGGAPLTPAGLRDAELLYGVTP